MERIIQALYPRGLGVHPDNAMRGTSLRLSHGLARSRTDRDQVRLTAYRGAVISIGIAGREICNLRAPPSRKGSRQLAFENGLGSVAGSADGSGDGGSS
jgi:hypothetical protein